LAYADFNLATGHVSLVQAGHPHPAIQRTSGLIEFLGGGGMPVGLIDFATYERIEAKLEPGDRLFLMSDGITEAENRDGLQLGEEGLADIMKRCAHLHGLAYLEALLWHLSGYSTDEFVDDVSGAVLEYRGP
jgi:sigma-B regulation protein RsbU (phosphoserine phosphatase)